MPYGAPSVLPGYRVRSQRRSDSSVSILVFAGLLLTASAMSTRLGTFAPIQNIEEPQIVSGEGGFMTSTSDLFANDCNSESKNSGKSAANSRRCHRSETLADQIH